jgi:hypothetical protein
MPKLDFIYMAHGKILEEILIEFKIEFKKNKISPIVIGWNLLIGMHYPMFGLGMDIH